MYGAAEILEGAAAAHAAAEEHLPGVAGDQGSALRSLKSGREELSEAREACEAGRAEVERLDAELSGLAGGEAGERAARLRREGRSLQRQSVMQQGLAEADEKEARKLEDARRMISDSSEVAECPTCKRDFKPGRARGGHGYPLPAGRKAPRERRRSPDRVPPARRRSRGPRPEIGRN